MFLCGLGAKNKEQESKTMGKISFFGSRFISRAVNTENPVPLSFFAPKLNGNACYPGYCSCKLLTTLGDHSFGVANPKLWSDLPHISAKFQESIQAF